MSQLAYYNPEIDQKMGKVKMTKCPEECGKQWRPKQEKPGWQKQKEEERGRRETRRKQEEENKKEKALEVKKVAEEWEIWDKEEKVTRSEEKAKKLVPEQSHKWIKVFEKKSK